MTTDAINEFETFRRQCTWLYEWYDVFSSLYESDDETAELLRRTDHVFFDALNLILVHYGLLQISKLTDPPKSCGNDNLSIKYINGLVADDHPKKAEIQQYSDRMHELVNDIRELRKKMLAHNDKDTLVEDTLMLSFASKEHEVEFFDLLQKYADAVGEAIGAGSCPLRLANITAMLITKMGRYEKLVDCPVVRSCMLDCPSDCENGSRPSVKSNGGDLPLYTRTFYVYILSSKSRKLYCGVTSDLARRLYEHKNKLVPGFTSSYNIDRLVYYEETPDVNVAISREKQLKTWRRDKKVALIEAVNPLWGDLSEGW